MIFKNPPEILHSEKRPACYRAMIEACARNIHLRKQATALLMYYAGQANYFRPALETVEKETGIHSNKVSELRKTLHDHGLIAYHDYPGFIYISWRNIRAYARLQKPLRLPRDKAKYRFFPAEVDRRAVERKKIFVGARLMNEWEYFEMVEAVRESLFPSMPKGEYHKTGVHNRDTNRAFPPSSNETAEVSIDGALPFPIIVTETLPF